MSQKEDGRPSSYHERGAAELEIPIQQRDGDTVKRLSVSDVAHGGPSTDVKEPPELTLNCSSPLAVSLSVSTPDVADISPSFVDMT